MLETNVSVSIDLSFREIQSIKLAHNMVRKLRALEATDQSSTFDFDEFMNEYRLYAIDLDFIEPIVLNTKKDLKALEGFL